jgi:hypothetical protein
MAVTTDLNTLWSDKTDKEDMFTIRALLENATNVILETDAQLEPLLPKKDLMPKDLKKAIDDWEKIVKDAQRC